MITLLQRVTNIYETSEIRMKKHIFRPLVWMLTVAMLLQITPIVLAQEKPETVMTVR